MKPPPDKGPRPREELTVEQAKALGLGKPRKRSKYSARKTVVDDITFDSAKEARRYGELRLLQQAGRISGLKLQPAFELVVNTQLVAVYKADFTYTDAVGEQVVEDVKGVKTTAYKLKAKLLRALFDITIKET
jgi:hypothetical protein